MTEDLQIISYDRKSGITLLKILEVDPKCKFCNKEITEENFGGVFSKPTRVCCDNICCLSEAISFEGE